VGLTLDHRTLEQRVMLATGAAIDNATPPGPTSTQRPASSFRRSRRPPVTRRDLESLLYDAWAGVAVSQESP
jgi:hypothetical protein